MLYGWNWIFLITVASTLTGIPALRADIRTIRTSYVCENGVMRLRCDQPNILEIHGADYGGAAAFICGNGEGSDEPCALVDKTQIVKSRCDNKPTCAITALGSIFGDPCPGLNKYLNVMYACVTPVSSETIPTTTQAPTSGIAITEDIATTNNSTLVNLTTTANITQPPSTEPTQKTQEKPKQTNRPGDEGPITQKSFPTFNPADSGMALSDSARATRFCAVGSLFLVCFISVISVWWL